MKKGILIMCLVFGFSQISDAQVAFGLKGGVNYNSNSIEESGTDVFSGAKSKTGYHAGIWLRLKVPVLGLYIRPELVYTNLENDVLYKATTGVGAIGGSITSQIPTTHSFQKIDIPVLFGKKFFGVGNIYIGPSFQYVLASDFSIDEITSVDSKGFTMGLQFGGGIELGKLGIDARWERSFSGIESTLLGATDVNFDTRINQIIIGLSYRL